jgi:hypothetical protein
MILYNCKNIFTSLKKFAIIKMFYNRKNRLVKITTVIYEFGESCAFMFLPVNINRKIVNIIVNCKYK